MYLFVYGTLRRGECNYHVMRMADGQFVQEDAVKGSLPHPLMLKPGDEWIPGEVFEVPEAGVERYIDPIEGIKYGVYTRREVELRSGLKANVYFHTFGER